MKQSKVWTNRRFASIYSLLDEIPNMYKDTHITETILGPVIEAGLDALKVRNFPFLLDH